MPASSIACRGARSRTPRPGCAQRGWIALPYHAGLDADDARSATRTASSRTRASSIVATIAFGMGIDKPDVRFVAHLDLPKRSRPITRRPAAPGATACPPTAWMTYGMARHRAAEPLIDGSRCPSGKRSIERQKLDALLGFCETATAAARCCSAISARRSSAVRQLRYLPEAASASGRHGAAQKALSAVIRTGQRFGAAYLIDVLLGKATERIRVSAMTRSRPSASVSSWTRADGTPSSVSSLRRAISPSMSKAMAGSMPALPP